MDESYGDRKARHRVVRGALDGVCFRCGRIEMKNPEKLYCFGCGFKISRQDADQAMQDFANEMHACYERFAEWLVDCEIDLTPDASADNVKRSEPT